MYHQSRGGTRGGQDQFSWETIKTDKDRQSYLGHSVKAPIGRWQKGKDIMWYTHQGGDNPLSRKEQLLAQAELERVEMKSREHQLMLERLGLATKKEGEGSRRELDAAEKKQLFGRGLSERNEIEKSEREAGLGFAPAPKHAGFAERKLLEAAQRAAEAGAALDTLPAAIAPTQLAQSALATVVAAVKADDDMSNTGALEVGRSSVRRHAASTAGTAAAPTRTVNARQATDAAVSRLLADRQQQQQLEQSQSQPVTVEQSSSKQTGAQSSTLSGPSSKNGEKNGVVDKKKKKKEKKEKKEKKKKKDSRSRHSKRRRSRSRSASGSASDDNRARKRHRHNPTTSNQHRSDRTDVSKRQSSPRRTRLGTPSPPRTSPSHSGKSTNSAQPRSSRIGTPSPPRHRSASPLRASLAALAK